MVYGMRNVDGLSQAGAGLGAGIGHLIRNLTQGNPNQNYYNAAIQAMGGTPQNVQGISQFSPQQVQSLVQEQQNAAENAGKLKSLGVINPAYQNLPAGVNPGYLYDYTTATQIPVARAQAQQQAEVATQGPLFEAAKPSYLQNPEAIYGEDHPVTQFAKQHPDQWNAFVNAAKTQDQLEGMVKPFTTAREQAAKSQKEQLGLEAAKTEISGEQAKQKEAEALLPYKMAQYEKELKTTDSEDKSDFEDFKDSVTKGVSEGWLTPEQAHQALVQKIGITNNQATMRQQLEQMKESSRQHTANLNNLKSMATNKNLTPQQRQQYLNQFNQQSGITGPQPQLKFPWKG